jgi:hypothetical protein
MMFREPDEIPLRPGVFALVNRKRNFVYVSYTGNLQKRSHSMSHMLLTYDADPKCYWPIRDLPKHPSDEYTFKVERLDEKHDGDSSLAAVASAQKRYVAKGFRIITGHRATSPTVVLDRRRMTLAAAVRDYSQVKYLTVYRRLERGWTIKQALGLEPPAPRWHHDRQAERREHEKERAAA